MRSSLLCLLLAAPGWTMDPAVVEDFTAGRTSAVRPQEPGEFTREGWRVTGERCQMKWDLGRHYPRGTVEFDVKGPLKQEGVRSLFSAWNEEAAADGDRQTQGFFQLRVMRDGMMLRLSYRPAGRSIEGYTGPLEWNENRWYHIKGSWDTEGGLSHLWRDGELVSTGRFSRPFEGFRWIFIGKDNYQKFISIPGLVYRNLRATVERPAPEPSLDLYFPPPGEGFDVQSLVGPEEAGFDPAVIVALEDVAPRWALWRNGRLVHVKGDFNETSNVASQRKTWHALTVGAAIQLGKIESLDERISEWNKDLTGEHAKASWWHVITQSAGFDYPYGEYPAYPPGAMWTYSDYNPVQLCNALARVWGRKDYHDQYETVVKEAYFDAIGMRGWEIAYTKDPAFEGADDGVRFVLDLEDMGRLGLLALARGAWNGKQLVPAWFVRQLERKQTYGMLANHNGPNDGVTGLSSEEFPEAPYGFMTWVNTDGDRLVGADRAWAYAMGARGHLTMWNRRFGIVFAAAGVQDPTGVATALEKHLRDDQPAAIRLEAAAVEIATGKMLGPGYDSRSFYVRDNGAAWRKTYSDSSYRPEAAGRLMNLRVAQGLFHDEWMTEVPFAPEKNTDRLIQALDAYKAHGILAISVSLQGGNPAYERHPRISRDRPHKLGPGKGSLISAFRPDGSLKDAWMQRLLRLVRELNRRGMILGLLYYYQHQDEVLAGPEAVEAGVRNVTDWLIDHDCRNVIIEIANEYNSDTYDHDRYIFHHMDRLIELARSRFQAKQARFRLPISASTGGMPVFDSVTDHADLVVIHGNNRSPEEKSARVAELVADISMPGPIYMNEDDNGRETTRKHLALELASCDAAFESGGSWGYMPWVQLQNFPFRHYAPGASAEVRDDMPADERDPAYFKAVLMHVRALLMR